MHSLSLVVNIGSFSGEMGWLGHLVRVQRGNLGAFASFGGEYRVVQW